MTFAQSVKTCLRKYFTFSGRASRSEYWWFTLFCLLGGLIASALEALINGLSGTPDGPTLLSLAFNIATFIPGIAVGFRRMHDTGRSGLYLFYPAIAIIGLMTFIGLFSPSDSLTPETFTFPEGIVGTITMLAVIIVLLSPFIVIWWLTRPSQPGQNRYGPNPHEVLQ
ncbi:MAG: DUF805 domain-containing protein [Paracoccaceae bacterium]